MAFATVTLSAGTAQAGLVATETVLHPADAAHDRSQVAAFMKRADVRQQMEALGVDPEEAEARLAGLSDQEVGQIAGRIDSLPAGEGALETLIVAGLFIFLILLMTDILGFTNIFSFVNKPVRR
jgi:hypothetical protein